MSRWKATGRETDCLTSRQGPGAEDGWEARRGSWHEAYKAQIQASEIGTRPAVASSRTKRLYEAGQSALRVRRVSDPHAITRLTASSKDLVTFSPHCPTCWKLPSSPPEPNPPNWSTVASPLPCLPCSSAAWPSVKPSKEHEPGADGASVSTDQPELLRVMVAVSSGGGRVFLRVAFGSRPFAFGEKSDPEEEEDGTGMAKMGRDERGCG